jgi:drug/metabolite transporter (DMT)-like permease
MAHCFTTDETMTANRVIGVLIGFAGVILMMGFDALEGLGHEIAAQLAVLVAALSYAFAGVYGRRFHRMGIDPLLTATGQVASSSLILFPIAFVAERPWTLSAPSTEVWLAVIAVASLSTALAYILYFRILSMAGATNLLLVTILIPVSAIMLGTAVLGEHLEARNLLGMAFIGAGLAVIDGRLLRWHGAVHPRS